VRSIFAAMLFFVFSAQVSAQSTGLIEAAKKEGSKVVVYGSLESEAFDAVKAGFEKKTGLQLDYWRASGTKTMERAVSEYRSGKPLYDAILLNANVARLVANEGMLAKYDSPSAAQFPKEAIDTVLGPSYRNVIIGGIYNKSMLSPADAPKTLEDLARPQFKGKLAMPDPGQHVTTTQWLANLQKIIGREKAEKLIPIWHARDRFWSNRSFLRPSA